MTFLGAVGFAVLGAVIGVVVMRFFGPRPPGFARGLCLSADQLEALGYLQELNRCYLHPLGLHLCKTGNDLGPMLDWREQPERAVFESFTIAGCSAASRIESERIVRRRLRVRELGYVVQPAE